MGEITAWSEQWENDDGDVVIYGFRYTAPAGESPNPRIPMEVLISYFRADTVKALEGEVRERMTDLLSSLRIWWRWRMRRSQVHIPGIIEFRMVATVVALQGGSFSVNNDPDGPTYFVMANPWIADVKVGDRVEIEPRFASSRASGRWYGQSFPDWVLKRKLDPEQT